MFTRSVVDPTGRKWSVSLEIIPSRQGIGFRERFIYRLFKKQKDGTLKTEWADTFLAPLPDSIDDIRLLLVFIVIAAVFTFIGWPLLLLLADLLWLLLAVLGAVMSFVILRRPITISARSGEETHQWKARNLAEARRRKQEVVLALLKGHIL